jgi:hypothetical protein
MVISPVQISKSLSLMLTEGPMGTLATTRTENSWSDFWAIVVVAAGTRVSGLVVGEVAEEVEEQDPFFLRSASRSGMKLSDKSNHSDTFLFSSIIGEKMQGYPIRAMATILTHYHEHVLLDSF